MTAWSEPGQPECVRQPKTGWSQPGQLECIPPGLSISSEELPGHPECANSFEPQPGWCGDDEASIESLEGAMSKIAEVPSEVRASSKNSVPEVRASSKNSVPDARSKSCCRTRAFESPVFAVLVICFCTLCYGAISMLAAPPWGMNSGPEGSDCEGPSFVHFGVCICPRETVCVRAVKDMVFLAFARLSAYFDYPLYTLVFLSKAHNLRKALARTYFSEFLPLDDLHQFHVFAGKIIGVEVVWHAFWHILRWSLAGEIHFRWRHITGISGMISLTMTPLITLPMLLKRFRKKISYEARKRMHYLSVVWCFAICFHAPARHIGTIMGTALCIYVLDFLYGLVFGVHYIETIRFTRQGQDVYMAWDNPPGFVNDGTGYVYVCLPWISKTEWHAFSLSRNLDDQHRSLVCMAAVGDWTRKVHSRLQKPSCRPGWVYGPFPSPFITAPGYENIVTVASGIGVTPCFATIARLGHSRQVHLIWVCRDADLIEFYLRSAAAELRGDAWCLIFYTGRQRLLLGRQLNPKVKIFLGRPRLQELLRDVIDSVHNGVILPKDLLDEARAAERFIFGKNDLEHFGHALKRALSAYSIEEMFQIGIDNTDPIDGEPSTHLSLTGFVEMAKSVCNSGGEDHEGLTDEEYASCLSSVDAHGNGWISRDEFHAVVTRLVNKVGELEAAREREADELEKRRVSKSLLSLSTSSYKKRQDIIYGWGLMYCGGSAPIQKELKEFERRYRVPLKIESFKW